MTRWDRNQYSRIHAHLDTQLTRMVSVSCGLWR